MSFRYPFLFGIFILLFWLFCVQCEDDLEKHYDSSKGFRIELKRQKSTYEHYINHGPALKKYGLNKHDWFNTKPKPHPPRTNDSIALKRYFDNEFYAEVIVGHPGQKMYVSFDTSWTVSWVLSARCSGWDLNYVGCLFHNLYDDTKSPFHIPDGRPFNQSVGKYMYRGVYVYDNISFAHSNITKQSFVEMEEVPYSLLFSKADGVLGLGLKVDDSYDPFFYTLLKQKKIANPLFSVYLNRDKQSDRGGNIILGFIEKRHIHSKKDQNNNTIYDEIVYLNLQPSSYWQFPIDSVGIANTTQETPIELCPDKNCYGITDTSSNNILGHPGAIKQIHNFIKAQKFLLGRYTVNCDTINKLPLIHITLGGTPFTLKGPNYIVKMSYNSFTICVSAFVPHDNYPEGFWVLGGTFLSEVYTVYDVSAKKIGFVKAA